MQRVRQPADPTFTTGSPTLHRADGSSHAERRHGCSCQKGPFFPWITPTPSVRPNPPPTPPRLTRLPASNWKLAGRGCIDPGCHADVVVFDPATIRDNATFDEPQQYASGVVHVLVNGVPVLKDGEHTGARPGRVVRGPGWSGAAQ